MECGKMWKAKGGLENKRETWTAKDGMWRTRGGMWKTTGRMWHVEPRLHALI